MELNQGRRLLRGKLIDWHNGEKEIPRPPHMPQLISRLLESAALLLTVVNGLMLLWMYLRDKPVLKVWPIHPEEYQWWFRLPDGTYQGRPTRCYGFLIYVCVANSGHRNTTLSKWRLSVRDGRWRSVELKALSIPEPKVRISTFEKYYPVLGQKGLQFGGETSLPSGGSVSGMAYYHCEVYGDPVFDPRMTTDRRIAVMFRVRDIFGKRARARFVVKEVGLEFVKGIVPGIEDVAIRTDEGISGAAEGSKNGQPT